MTRLHVASIEELCSVLPEIVSVDAVVCIVIYGHEPRLTSNVINSLWTSSFVADHGINCWTCRSTRLS